MHEVLDLLGVKNEPLLDIAMELEKIALNDEYFIEKKLYPNVDFYSDNFKSYGISYRYVHSFICSSQNCWLGCSME